MWIPVLLVTSCLAKSRTVNRPGPHPWIQMMFQSMLTFVVLTLESVKLLGSILRLLLIGDFTDLQEM